MQHEHSKRKHELPFVFKQFFSSLIHLSLRQCLKHSEHLVVKDEKDRARAASGQRGRKQRENSKQSLAQELVFVLDVRRLSL
jgi:hypothetical protein